MRVPVFVVVVVLAACGGGESLEERWNAIPAVERLELCRAFDGLPVIGDRLFDAMARNAGLDPDEVFDLIVEKC